MLLLHAFSLRSIAAQDTRFARVATLVHVVLAALLVGCARDPAPIREERFVFGTRVELTVVHAEHAAVEAALAEIGAIFAELHRRYHAWEPSEVTALNEAIAAHRPAVISAELAAILRDAQQWVAASDGLFDPGIGALVALWGFHRSDFSGNVPPAPEAVAALTARRPSLAALTITPLSDPASAPCRAHDGEGGTSLSAEERGRLEGGNPPSANSLLPRPEGFCVQSRNPAVQVDLGGYLKGEALDRAAAILRRHGIANALINIGGNLLALGQPTPRRPWRVALQHPRAADPLAVLPLYDGEAIGTSGDYQRYFFWEGQRYHHLIDPRTGAPSTTAQAVTVVIEPQPHGRTGLRSDVLSKPLFLAGEAWLAYAERLGVTQALKVAPDGSVTVTAKLRQRLTWVTEPDAVTVVSIP